jgi:large subunit ribosomal protein L19
MSSILLKKSSVYTSQLRSDIPDFKVGSVVSVHYKIKEGDKERIQIFTGIVVDRHGGYSLEATFKVLKVAAGSVKVMRNFPLHSPNIDKVIVNNYQRGRRATLNYLIKAKDPIKAIRSKSVKPRTPVAIAHTEEIKVVEAA